MEIRFYTSSSTRNYVGNFIDGLSPKAKKKVFRDLELVEKYGTPFANMVKLKGYKMYEIKIKFDKIAYRIFCFVKNSICWLLHMFMKKSNQTPQKELNTAWNRALEIQSSLTVV